MAPGVSGASLDLWARRGFRVRRSFGVKLQPLDLEHHNGRADSWAFEEESVGEANLGPLIVLVVVARPA